MLRLQSSCLALILLASQLNAENFSAEVDLGNIGLFTWQYVDLTPVVTATNIGASNETFGFNVTLESHTAPAGFQIARSSPTALDTLNPSTVAAGATVTRGTSNNWRLGVRPSDVGLDGNDYTFGAVLRVEVTSDYLGDAVIYDWLILVKVTCHVSTGVSTVHNASPPIEFSISNDEIDRPQVVYEFETENVTGESQEFSIMALVDSVAIEVDTFTVLEGERSYFGAFTVAADSFSLLYPGGILTSGQASWVPLEETEPSWLAGIYFGEDPDEIQVRLNADVFSSIDQVLTVRDSFGNVIGSIDVAAGVYSAQIDLEYTGLPGEEIQFEVSGAGYQISADGPSVVASGYINAFALSIHEEEDPPTVGNSTTVRTLVDGQLVETEVRTLSNSMGSFTGTPSVGGPFSPSPGFSSGYSISSTGTGVDTLARIDAEVGSFMSRQGPLVVPNHSDKIEQAEAIADGIESAITERGIGLAEGPSPLGSVGIDDTWTVSLGTIAGIEVPDINVPLDSPVIPVIRMLLLVASSIWWLFKGFQLIKT